MIKDLLPDTTSRISFQSLREPKPPEIGRPSQVRLATRTRILKWRILPQFRKAEARPAPRTIPGRPLAERLRHRAELSVWQAVAIGAGLLYMFKPYFWVGLATFAFACCLGYYLALVGAF